MAQAQETSNLRSKKLVYTTDTLQLDSMSIIKGSYQLKGADGQLLDSATYEIDWLAGQLIWKTPPTDSIRITYRVYPFSFTQVAKRKDIARIERPKEILLNPFEYRPNQTGIGGIDFGALDYNGSFSRGLSFGNNQDVVLNSSFNLQLSGYITSDIEVTAALTDNNIPIQPDGNTQQIQEFDRIFIRVRKAPHELTVGDFEIRNRPSHFMVFYKNLQGGSYRANFGFNEDKFKYRTQTSLAVAQGKFSRNRLAVSEGNQGPYKLTGANGETFIIVLAGTERVYVNGELKQRGADRDYVMDYNLGEITFTPNQLITQDLRVIVEFEYSDQNYFRTFAFSNHEFESEKANVRLNFYSEQDNKNNAINADLTTGQRQFLSNLGNNLNDAFFPGYRADEFDPNRILYKLIIDSIVDGTTYDTVFVYSTNGDSANYILSFAFVGQGRGDYVPAATTANGRVYRWEAPVNGVRQGSYSPVILLVTPKREQIISLAVDLKPTKDDFWSTEAVLSNDDLNTFSTIGNENNLGTAIRTDYRRDFYLGATTKPQGDSTVAIQQRDRWIVTPRLGYEFVGKNFSPLQRFRKVEFDRDWNFTTIDRDTVMQHLIESGVKVGRKGYGTANYEYEDFRAGDRYKGRRQNLTTNFDRQGYRLDGVVSFLKSNRQGQTSRFIRANVEASKGFKQLKGWRVGSKYEHDNNKIQIDSTDEFTPASFVWTEWKVYISAPDTARNKAMLEYKRRLEFDPDSTEFDLSNYSNTYSFTGEWGSNRYQKLGWQLTYRRFEGRDTARFSGDLEEYYLGRLEYGLNVLKGAISTSILYELGAGQEQRRDFTYVPVAAGQGTFIWIDYNENGLQEANEFEVSPTGFNEDTMYIRVVNPSNEFDPVNITVYNQTLNIRPRAVWNDKEDFRGFLARLSSLSSLQVNRKVFRDAELSPFNPFVFDVDDEALVTINSIFRNTIFFNRSSQKYSLEYTWQDNRNKTNLTSGFETRRLYEHIFRLRYNIKRSLNTIIKYSRGGRTNNSEFFSERNYVIDFHNVEPQITYLFKNKFRATLMYDYRWSENTLISGNGEKAINNELSLESRYNIVSKSSVNLSLTYASVNYNGPTNTPIEFAMLQGLQDGNNYIWQLSWDRNLGRNVQLNLTYEGRKTGSSDMIHTGRAQVRAIF